MNYEAQKYLFYIHGVMRSDYLAKILCGTPPSLDRSTTEGPGLIVYHEVFLMDIPTETCPIK